MKNEKKSGNANGWKEAVVICLLILLFFILIIIGQGVVERNREKNNIEIQYNQPITKPDEIDSGDNISEGKSLAEIIQNAIIPSGEELENAGTLENYEFETESIKISDFKASKIGERIDIIGNIDNLTNEKIDCVRIRTKLYDSRNVLIQEVSSSVYGLEAKSSRTYSFSKPDNSKEIAKVKVELLKDDILQGEHLIDIGEENTGK